MTELRRRFIKLAAREIPEEAVIERKESAGTSALVGFGVIIFVLSLIWLAFVQHQSLPTALKLSDEEKYPESFIGERAEQDLMKLVSIGPKASGSYECNILAVKVLRKEIALIAATSNVIHSIKEDLQRPSGSFHLVFQKHGSLTIYDQILNIAVRIGPKPPSKHSILVNCHYDTVPESPGASDNGLNCAVMLEVLRKISRQTTPLKHNIIFLFNGAEETPLQASHGFITKHHWREEVRVVVNLDAAGAGGREVMFQVSRNYPWLVTKYAQSAPHPSANLFGQELFETGIIPSDTDFRIFRDFGHIPGVDLAHGDNGYIYHTRYDKMDYISPGVYQHTGDNLLAYLRALADSDELSSISALEEPDANSIYFDLFGIYLFEFGKAFDAAISFVTVSLVAFSVWKVFSYNQDEMGTETLKDIFLSMGKALIIQVISCIAVLVVAVVIDQMGASLCWYSKQFLIIPLYVFPYMGVSVFLWSTSKRNKLQNAVKVAYSQLAWLTIFLTLILLTGYRVHYILNIIILPVALSTTIFYNTSAGRLLILFGCCSFLGVFNALCNFAALFLLMIPILGRFNPSYNPEIIVGFIVIVCNYLVGNLVLPFLLTVQRIKYVVTFFFATFFLFFIAVVFSPLGFPYSGDLAAPAMQRFQIHHTSLKVHTIEGIVTDEKSSIIVTPLDRNQLKYVRREMAELRESRKLYSSLPFEGYPYYTSRSAAFLKASVQIDAEPPFIQFPTTFKLVGKNVFKENDTITRLTFSMKGPDRMSVVFRFPEGIKFIGSSEGNFETPVGHEGSDYYAFTYTLGTVNEPLTLSIDLQVLPESREKLIEVVHVGHYLHQKASYSKELTTFLSKFPSWAVTISWISSVNIYVFSPIQATETKL